MKVLLVETETLCFNNDVSLDVFDSLAEVKKFETLDRNRLFEEVKDVDAILCNKTIINREVFEKAKNLIGYNPKTSFKEGISKFVEWYKKQN